MIFYIKSQNELKIIIKEKNIYDKINVDYIYFEKNYLNLSFDKIIVSQKLQKEIENSHDIKILCYHKNFLQSKIANVIKK